MFKVFIGCLPGNSDKRELKAILQKHAKITSLSIIPESGSRAKFFCKGFAFAICASQEEAQSLLDMNGRILYKNRHLSFRLYKKGAVLAQERTDFNTRRIFIGNIPQEISEESIVSAFSAYGSVENVFFIGCKKALKLKFGYVVFRDTESSNRILQEQPVINFLGRTLRIEGYAGKKVEHSVKKEKEQKQLVPGKKIKLLVDSGIEKNPEDRKYASFLTKKQSATTLKPQTETRSRKSGSSDKSLPTFRQDSNKKGRFSLISIVCQRCHQVESNHSNSNLRLNLLIPHDQTISQAQSSNQVRL